MCGTPVGFTPVSTRFLSAIARTLTPPRRTAKSSVMAKSDLPEALRQRIQDTIEGYDTVLFMKGTAALPQCRFSANVVELLKRTGVDFHTVNVLADAEVREGIKVYNDWPTIPQLYHRGKFIGGSDIITEMFESGELQKELGA